jgi:hypothetical protein
MEVKGAGKPRGQERQEGHGIQGVANGKHHNVHKPSKKSTREHKLLPRNVENVARASDNRRRLMHHAKKDGDACGPWRGR